MSFKIKTLFSFMAITMVTVWFNYHIIQTQDIGDSQFWHITQLIQWVIVYLAITWISKEYIILIGYALIYPFLYDGLLNTLLSRGWFYGGVEGYGADYTLDYRIKVILLSLGLFILFTHLYLDEIKKIKQK